MLRDEWQKIVPTRVHLNCEYEIVKKSGERRWVLEIGQAIYGAQGETVALEGIIIDITEQKKRENEIIYLSEHDFPIGAIQ